ncbi:MAG: sterol desaturase family protein [Deltaproteobacteria bacterium]|jgi:sterol desaturase/sphingolipid hydroxylase (fatty acid hydroxylase superfamily)|nr:sterol desaturase family protein [Deltaproteobacteria bacterium]MBT6435694.1 sterol desaturase family protein [Deltaproteobacteria bacterium]MBT6490507.1 sterol desaturase family protein [Deltaproteobacteria bacterium]
MISVTTFGTITAAIVVGAVGWSFTEYCIHRWLGHDRRFLRNPFGVEHQTHHSKGNYFAQWWKKAGAAIAAIALLWWPATVLLGAVYGSAFIFGFVAFYLYYEILHRVEHVFEASTAYGRWARAHHFFHHFHDPSRNHGVTSPVWDHVFGTYSATDVIRVPEKLAPLWLIEPTTGDVWQHLQPTWVLRKLKKRAPKRAPTIVA